MCEYRLNEYIEIIMISAPENTELVETLGKHLIIFFPKSVLLSFFILAAVSITDTTSNIIAQNPPEEILDEVYEVVENLEVSLLCSKTCGQEASVILVCLNILIFIVHI